MSEADRKSGYTALDWCLRVAGETRTADYLASFSELVSEWGTPDALYCAATAELSRLRACVEEYEPYYMAICERHNGYKYGSPPITPEAALDSLCDKSESLASATIDLLAERVEELESELERLRAECEHKEVRSD